MILKRQEKNGKIKAMYSSSTICGSVYDTATKDLTVIFNNGGQYKYPNVEATDYMRLETADSNGTAFSTYIKKKYTAFEKLDKLSDAALSMIIKEIDELKTAEDSVSTEVKTKTMLEAMNVLIGSYISTGKIDASLLNKVEARIGEYNKASNPEPTSAND
jgi:hypothetical protein